MVSQAEAHESTQILLFVCAPLFLLLIVLIVIRARSSRQIAKFSNFSVRTLYLGHEGEAFIQYREAGELTEFRLMPTPKRKSMLMWPLPEREAVLVASKKISDENLRRIIPNLVLGLAKLRFHEYRLYCEDEKQIIVRERTKD